MFGNKVYEHMEHLLISLKKSGLRLIVATSKPTDFAEHILKHFNLDRYFDCIIGSNLDGTRIKKGEIIKYIIDKYNIGNFNEVVMIGDHGHQPNIVNIIDLSNIIINVPKISNSSIAR